MNELIERALHSIDNEYPLPMNEENLRIEYLILFDRNDTNLTPEQQAHRIINVMNY